MKRVILLIVTALSLLGKAAINAPGSREFQIIRHNVNNVELCVSNYGKLGQDETGNNGGCWWPVGSGHCYVYGAGPWVGAIDSMVGDTMVTIGYGPQGGESEFAPGLCGMSVSHPAAIIYLYPHPWPPPAAAYPTAPREPLSHQDSWCVYNDADMLYHIAGDTRPIRIEIHQTVYVWNLTLLLDVVYITYVIKNVLGQGMTDLYFGMCTDIDIGNEAGGGSTTDLCGAIVGQWFVIDGDSFYVDNLAYQWQEVIEQGTPPWWPAAIGFDLIRTPYDLVEGEDKDNDSIMDQYERDSTYYANNVPASKWDVDSDGVPDWRDPSQIPQLGMTAFKLFTLNLEPNLDHERYMTLAGYNFRTGIYEPYDTVTPDPDDQRWLQCSGPFELMPDSSVTVVLAILFANWHGSYMRPDTALALVDYWVQLCHDTNWLIPGPPPAPGLALVPGDAKITLLWDNQPEQSADPWFSVVGVDSASPYYDPHYRQYDFEGYRVWKSSNGQIGTWQLLSSCDLRNDIVFEDTLQPDSIRLRATDTGLFHTFTDENVRNGFLYYYAVTAFDYNWVKTVSGLDTFPRPVWFESGKTAVCATARRDPVNLVAGSCDVRSLYGNPELEDIVSVHITSPFDMTADPMYADFAPIVFDGGLPHYSASLLDARYNTLGTLEATMAAGQSADNDYVTHHGLNVAVRFARPVMTIGSLIYDRVEVMSGSYPVAGLTPRSMGVTYGLWAYRGNSYELHWTAKNPGGEVNSVVVIDAYNGDTIPYAPFLETAATDSLAMSWAFHRGVNLVSDTLEYDPSTSPPPLGTRYLYICGGKVNLKGGLELYAGDPRPAKGDVWLVHASPDFDPVPAHGRVQIMSTPAYFDTLAVNLNVKVVPNPYIISNEWQTQFVQRRVKFIDLPNRCTIRIFNLNGELVRTMKHYETSSGGLRNDLGGDKWWNVLNDYDQLVASGVYIFHVESDIGDQVGKFVVVD